MGLCLSLSMYHVCIAHGGQKKAPDPLELELEVTVSCHVGARADRRTVSALFP